MRIFSFSAVFFGPGKGVNFKTENRIFFPGLTLNRLFSGCTENRSEMRESTFEKYKLVVDEWFANGFNGRQAYLKFYPSASEESAEREFHRISRIPKVADYISEQKKHSQKALRTSHEALLAELERWAYSDITNVIELSPEGVKSLPVEIRRLITSFETKTRILTDGTRIVTVKCTFVSKEKAMEMIHKHTGFYAEHNFQKNVELSSAERKEILQKIEERRKRIQERDINNLL